MMKEMTYEFRDKPIMGRFYQNDRSVIENFLHQDFFKISSLTALD